MTRCKTNFVSLIAVAGAALAAGIAGCAAKAPTQQPEPRHVFWPEAPDPPRIQYLVSYNSSADLRHTRGGWRDVLYGRDNEQAVHIAKPYGVAMWDGRIYVCDVRGNGIFVLDLRGRQTRLMGATGAGAVQKAVDITVAADGVKYIADPNRAAVAVFDADERFVRNFSFPGSSPVGVAVYQDILYVVDFKQQHVKAVNRYSGEVLRTIGGPGGEDGGFVRPLGITVDADGNIYVSDVIRCRVQKFSADGELLLAFGEAGNRPGNFVRPKHLKVAADGILYAIDSAFNNVQLFDEEGKVMMFFGSAGSHGGAMDLPAGIFVHEADLDLFQNYIHPAFAAERLIIVTNQFGPSRVAVYAMGQLREGKTLEDITPGRLAAPSELAAEDREKETEER